MGITRIQGLAISGAFGALPPLLFAQSTGITTADLKGTVHDRAGRPLAGTKLVLRREGQGGSWTGVCDADGRYRFRLLPAGDYRLQALGPSGEIAARSVTLSIGTTREIDLWPAGELEVLVEAPAETERTLVSTVVDPDQIQNLPINRRSFVDFSLTTPFAATSNLPTGNGSPGSPISFSGMTPRQNNFLLDGLDNNDLGGGDLRASISQEAVQEFQVISGGFSAEQGRALGGIVNTVTKEGTNALKGSVFYFLRPGNLDSRSPFGTDNGDYRLRQYGASIGGPILKDSLFYFVAVERLQKTDHNVVAIDPSTAAAIHAAGFPFDTGKIPFEEGDTSGFLRVDWVDGPSSRWTFRVLLGQQKDENAIPWGGLTARTAGGSRSTHDQTFTVANQWTGTSWFNDFHLMRASRDNRIDSLDPVHGVYVEILGTAVFGTQRLADQRATIHYTQVADTLTTVRGNHTLKGGVDLLRSDNDATVAQNFAGVYRFQAIPALGVPSSLAAFLAPNPFGGSGLPVAFVQSYGNPSASFTVRSEAAFLQDDWQVAPSFLLKLGLRYERESLPAFPDTPDYEAIQHPPATVDPVLGPTQLPAGAYDYPANFRVQRDWSAGRVHPRLSFSWEARPDLRFHGGAGRFGGPTNLGIVYGVRLFNGRDVQTVVRTLADPVMVGPLPAWANADGVARDHRYASLPPGPTTLVIPGSVGSPVMWQETLGGDWDAGRGHHLALDLVHSRARGLLNVRDVNAYQVYFNPATGQPVLRRPDLRYSTLNRVDGSGNADYDGQTLRWTWKPGGRFLLNASYTHSIAKDNTTDWTADYPPQNSFDPGSEWGPSLQNQTHRFLASAVASTGSSGPAWKRDWSFSGILAWASGRPYSVLAGYDRNLDGDGTSDRPEGVGRNSETAPSTANLDARITRGFALGKARLDLMAEVFNLFNRTNALQVQNVLNSATTAYGTPVRFGPKRQLQFGARFTF